MIKENYCDIIRYHERERGFALPAFLEDFVDKRVRLKGQTNGFLKYRHLLRELVYKNIKLQYRDSVLGMFWTFLQPLMTMIVMSVIFNNLFGRDSSKVMNYPVYLLCGKLLFDCFSSSTKRAMRSIRSHSAIIKKVYVPKYIYPLSNSLAYFVTFLISLSVLVCMIIFFNVAKIHPFVVTWRVLMCVIPIIVLFILSIGVGMFLAALNVFFKDIENIYDVLTLLLFYCTPIMYHISKLGLDETNPTLLRIIKCNPLFGIIQSFRACVLWGGTEEFWIQFDVHLLLYSFGCAVFAFFVGFILFYKTQDKFILHI